jgi:hypothetical protein
MTKSLTLLIASTALTAAIGLPAWSAVSRLAEDDGRPVAAAAAGGDARPLLLASDDEDDDHGERRRASGYGDDDDDDDDGEEGGRAGRDAAPAGTVAPPRNGLFGNGAAPQVQVN